MKFRFRSIARICSLSLGCVAACLTSACVRLDASDAIDPATVATSYRGAFLRRLVLTGELRADEATEITVPRTPMWIVRISWMIEDGKEVCKGDKILEFDNAAFSDALDEKRIAVDRALGNLDQARAGAEAVLINAQLRLERTRIARVKAELEAAVPEDLVSRKIYKEYKIALQRAVTEYEKALEDLCSAEETGQTEARVREVELAKIRREVATAENAIDELVIEAPEDGIVVVAEHPWEGRKFKEGDSPWVGLTVLRMPKLDEMAVKARLFDVDDGLLEAGTNIVCTLDTYPDLEFQGVVRDITPIAQEASPYSMRRAFDVNIDLKNTDRTRMRPGMSVRIEALIREPGTPVLAPRWAIELSDDGARVRLADGSWRIIEIGPCSAQVCIIENGLEEGVSLLPTWKESG